MEFQNYLKNLAQRNKANLDPHRTCNSFGIQGHIGENGLLYCNQCGEPIESTVKFPWYEKPIVENCVCKCYKEK